MSKQVQNRSKEEMFLIIEGWPSSGLTKKAYCKQKDIPQWLFFYWQKKYNEGQQADGFLPIKIRGESKNPAVGFIEVKYPHGVIVRLPDNMDPEVIRRFVYL